MAYICVTKAKKMTTINRNQLATEIKKINNIQMYSSLTQKELNKGFNLVMKAKVQLMFELEIPQAESELFQLLNKVSKSCKIYNEQELETIVDYIVNNTDEDFNNDISELLN